MHDYGCLPVSYPRGNCSGSAPKVHGGYIGTFPFESWPPVPLLDANDTTLDGSRFGYVELGWTLYVICSGTTASEPSTWSNIKSMYE